MIHQLLLLLLFVFSFATNANEKTATFDDVIFYNELTPEGEKIEAGFGIPFLLNLIEDKNVRPFYNEMRSLGFLRIYVQKLVPQNEGETKTTRLTFEAWRKTGFGRSELAASWTVDQYSSANCMDDGSDYYRVAEIVRHQK